MPFFTHLIPKPVIRSVFGCKTKGFSGTARQGNNKETFVPPILSWAKVLNSHFSQGSAEAIFRFSRLTFRSKVFRWLGVQIANDSCDRLVLNGQAATSAELKTVRRTRAQSLEKPDGIDGETRCSYKTQIRSCREVETLLLRNAIPYDKSAIVTPPSEHHHQTSREQCRIFRDWRIRCSPSPLSRTQQSWSTPT